MKTNETNGNKGGYRRTNNLSGPLRGRTETTNDDDEQITKTTNEKTTNNPIPTHKKTVIDPGNGNGTGHSLPNRLFENVYCVIGVKIRVKPFSIYTWILLRHQMRIPLNLPIVSKERSGRSIG